MRHWLDTHVSLEWAAVIIFYGGSVTVMAVCERLQRNRYRKINKNRDNRHKTL